MSEMAHFGNWIVGAVMVATAAVSGGYGAGMMWRAWQAVQPPPKDAVWCSLGTDFLAVPVKPIKSSNP